MAEHDAGFLAECAALAERAYYSAPPGGFRAIQVDDAESQTVVERALVASRVVAGRRRLVVAVKGTDVDANWLQNVDADLVPLGTATTPTTLTVRAHRGFARANDALLAAGLDGAIDRARDDNDVPLLFVGHSKGGAQATLLAARALLAADRRNGPSFSSFGATTQREPRVVELVTFGSPRPGDAALAALMAQAEADGSLRATRCVQSSDPVTCVPPERAGFRHCGAPTPVDAGATLASLLRGAVDAWDRQDASLVQSRLVESHAIASYIDRLKATTARGPASDDSSAALERARHHLDTVAAAGALAARLGSWALAKASERSSADAGNNNNGAQQQREASPGGGPSPASSSSASAAPPSLWRNS